MQEFILQAKRVNKFQQWFSREKALRAELEAKSVFFLRRDYAAGADTGVQHTHRNSRLLQTIGARQAGNSPADDNRGKRSYRQSGHETSIRLSERF